MLNCFLIHGNKPLEQRNVDKVFETVMNGLEKQFLHGFFDIWYSPSIQIAGNHCVVTPLIITDFPEIKESMVIIGTDFDIKALFRKFSVLPDIFKF